MRRLLWIFLSGVSVCAVNAQPMPMGRLAPQTLLEAGSGFLMVPAVQKELGLSATVSKKITDKYMASMRAMMQQQPQRRKEQDQKAQQAAFQAQIKKMRQAAQENLALLTPAQRTRLKQITIQQAGAAGLVIPEVKKTLNLTPAQEQRITAIVRDGSAQMFAGSRPNQGMPKTLEESRKRASEFAKKREGWRKKMVDESLKSLKPDQIAKWKAMQGKPFKFDMMGGVQMGRPARINQ